MFDSEDEQSEEEGGESEQVEDEIPEDKPKPKFAQTFIFSCIGIGL